MPEETRFDKYYKMGCYHWKECDDSIINWKTFNPALVARYEVVTEQVRKLKCKNLLDVGTGDGCLIGKLAPYAEMAVGVDTEDDAVKIAETMLRGVANVQIHKASGYSLPFQNYAFDAVISSDVIEHLMDPDEHVKEMARVTGLEGTTLITTPILNPEKGLDLYHVQEFTPDSLKQLLYRSFEDVSLRFFWPKSVVDFYGTRIGWRALKFIGIFGWNPFLVQSDRSEGFTQMLAICRRPKH